MSKPTAFISYGREDHKAAKRLFGDLRNLGADPWLDSESLLPGQKWKSEVKKALRRSRYFIALLSSHSVMRKGYVQREIVEALRILDEYPESDVFVIPARLDECDPSHETLSELHRVDLFPIWQSGIERIGALLFNTTLHPVTGINTRSGTDLVMITEKYRLAEREHPRAVDIFFSLRNAGRDNLLVYDLGLRSLEADGQACHHMHAVSPRVQLRVGLGVGGRSDDTTALLDENPYSFQQARYEALIGDVAGSDESPRSLSFRSVLREQVVTLAVAESQSFVLSVFGASCADLKAKFRIAALYHDSSGSRREVISRELFVITFHESRRPGRMQVELMDT